MKYFGATKVETDDSTHTILGQRLTAETARKLPGKCISCGTTEGTRFLLHLSVQSDGVVSCFVCEECTRQQTAFELFAAIIERTLEGVEGKRSTLQ